MVTINDHDLAKWLNKIYPIMEKELLKGITNVFEICNFEDKNELNLLGVQVLRVDQEEQVYS